MESIRKLENMKKHRAFLPSEFSSNLAALQMVSLQKHTWSKIKMLLINQARWDSEFFVMINLIR